LGRITALARDALLASEHDGRPCGAALPTRRNASVPVTKTSGSTSARRTCTPRAAFTSRVARDAISAPGAGFAGRFAASRNVVASISTWRGSKGFGK